MFLVKTKHRLIDTDFFNDFSDNHSHILFGVDDGMRDITESLEALEYYEAIGVKKVVFTPHINVSDNNWDLIHNNFNQLSNLYKGKIGLNLGAEYMLDLGFYDQMKHGLKCFDNDKVLVESSYLNQTAYFDDLLFQLSNDGYSPVLAHPERYLFMDLNKYHKLKNCDYLFQLNLLSLSSLYGREVKHRALYLLERGMYDLIGSDIHNLDLFKNYIKEIRLSKLQYLNLRLIKSSAK